DPECSNGVPGYESDDGLACCSVGCGRCGGAGCGGFGAPDLGGEECCTGKIASSGISCFDAGQAPCII
ncbi:unnamed protein product, partial [Hapterophycus canaliculatus]